MYSDKLPIYRSTYRLIQEVFACTVKFPRDHKFSLGSSLNDDALRLGDLVLRAAHANQQRAAYLQEYLLLLEKILLQLRLCADFNLLSCKRQALISDMVEKLNTQAISWLKTSTRKERRNKTKTIVPESGQDSELS